MRTPTYQGYDEDADYVVVIWRGTASGVVANPTGVGFAHDTSVISGVVSVQVDGQRPFLLSGGDSIQLPTRRGYTVSGIRGPVEVRCYYPKAVPGAVEEIQHLLRGTRGQFRRVDF